MHPSTGDGNTVSQPCRPTRHVVPDDGDSRRPFSGEIRDRRARIIRVMSRQPIHLTEPMNESGFTTHRFQYIDGM